ncbi:FecR family protein [Chryseobacterium camelliae]|uniref:FecR family protein n=1 Tax=Chryseobacterium camelliae TaxID=1265445 RepID=UPI00285A03C3|nr:FecR family protein [Chryseobacterium camelliae]MDR6513712.1 ferric-dicitrate binding protein FerR (iron transport regulator) [Chryseobacterium camelliae]
MDKRKATHPTAIDEAKELWDSLTNNAAANIDPPSEQEATEFHRKLYARIEAHEAQKRKTRTLRNTSLLAAASVIILCSIIAYRSLFLPDVYRAAHGDMKITLRDGSTATLEKGGILTVEKSFPGATREVFLQGDAVFNVTKSKIHPFIVHAGSYQTKVLGTVFKITQHAATFKVDLYEGKVQIVKKEKPTEAFVIHPKETFSNLGSNDIMTVAPTKSANILPRDNRATISFMDLRLLDVANMLELTYGIKVRYPADIAGLKISATKEHATAEDMLRLVALQLKLKTNKINDKVFELEN